MNPNRRNSSVPQPNHPPEEHYNAPIDPANYQVPENFRIVTPNNTVDTSQDYYNPEQLTPDNSYSPESMQTPQESHQAAATQQPSNLPPIDPTYTPNSYQLPSRMSASQINNPGQFAMPRPTSDSKLKRSKRQWWFKPLIISITALILVIGLLLVIFSVFGGSNQDKDNASNSSKPSETNPTSVVVANLSDLSNSCQSIKIDNAAKFNNSYPAPIALFTETTKAGEYILSDVKLADSSIVVNKNNYLQSQLVGCFSVVKTTDTGKTCKFQDENSDKQRNLALYNVEYELIIRDAKTSQQLLKKPVAGTDESCPFTTTFNESNPKLYADPNIIEVNKIINDYQRSL